MENFVSSICQRFPYISFAQDQPYLQSIPTTWPVTSTWLSRYMVRLNGGRFEITIHK